MTNNRLTRYILVALFAGIATGYVINVSVDAAAAKDAAYYFSIVTGVFLQLIKMIIAPLVLSTLTVGVAHMGSGGAVGRTFARTLAWFITASIVSLSLGILMVNLLARGLGSGCRCRRPMLPRGWPKRLSTSGNSSSTSSPNRFSKRWRPMKCCRSWCFRCSPVSG